MLRRILITVGLAAVLPMSASAQSIGVGVAARAGTLGLGGEVAVGLNRWVGVRAGMGAMPITYNGDFEDVRYRVVATSPISNIGVDFYPGLFDLRLGGGMMFISNPTKFDAQYSGSVTINGQDYSDIDVGDLKGELNHGSAAPYAIIGIGRQTNRGIGIFLDLGAAFLEEQRFTYNVSGPLGNDPTFQSELAAEAASIENDVNKYVKVFPILSAGIRFGFR